ncbi:MAG: hypothetical protein ACR2NR_04255 [Solirubrobacteraceae bacterium]
MSLPDSLLVAIGQAVQDAGGTVDDVDDLVHVWQRLDADLDSRVVRLGYEAAHAACCCATPAEPAEDGRCSRCWGHLGIER